jgi:pimeloyl-ACP methyl ester carboxylesterase
MRRPEGRSPRRVVLEYKHPEGAEVLATLLLLLLSTPPASAGYAFTVEVGGAGPPVVLIPGLGCQGAVWGSISARLEKNYTVHRLTLAGFGSLPAVPAPMLETVRRDLLRYLDDRKMAKPVLVGHSLGGVLALWIAATAPDRIGGAISVDGVPFLPAIWDPSATAESVTPRAGAMRDAMASADHDGYVAQTRRVLAMMVRREANLETAAKLCSAGDPKAAAQAMYELMTTDLRPLMPRAKTPILLLGAGFGRSEAEAKRLDAAYEAQIARSPDHRYAVNAESAHFIMLDEPQWLYDAITGFLAKHERAPTDHPARAK